MATFKFFIKKPAPNLSKDEANNQETSIYMKYRHKDYVPVEFATGEKVIRQYWNEDTEQVKDIKSTEGMADTINQRIKYFKSKRIDPIISDFIAQGLEKIPKDIKKAYDLKYKGVETVIESNPKGSIEKPIIKRIEVLQAYQRFLNDMEKGIRKKKKGGYLKGQ